MAGRARRAAVPSVGADVLCLLMLLGSHAHPLGPRLDIGSWVRNWSPKGRGGRRRGWSPPGKGDGSLTQPRWGPATRRLLQRMGLAGAAANSSAWGQLEVPMSCSSPRSAPAQTGRRPGKPPGRDCAGGHGRACGLRKPEPARNDAGRWEMARRGGRRLCARAQGPSVGHLLPRMLRWEAATPGWESPESPLPPRQQNPAAGTALVSKPRLKAAALAPRWCPTVSCWAASSLFSPSLSRCSTTG